MSNFLLSNEIFVLLSPSNFLSMYKNQRKRANINKVVYIPPTLGSNSLGVFKVTLRHEQSKKQSASI